MIAAMSPARSTSILGETGAYRLTNGRDGYFLYNQHDVYIGRSIEAYGEFSGIEGEFLASLLHEGDVVIEVGANIGAHSVGIAKKIGSTGRLLAFEPQRLAFQLLCANVALNNLTNVECFWMACGERPGTVIVPELDPDRINNFGGVSLADGHPGRPVPCAALDAFGNVERLRLIKADVEGMEADVLRGARTIIHTSRPLLYVENDRPKKSAELISLIHEFGYDAYWHLPPMYRPDNFRKNPKNLFPNTASLNLFGIPRERNVVPPPLKKIVSASDRPG